jgi:adenosylhomocysteine nucleosidase
MRVLVTFAVDAEFAPWRKLRHFSSLDYDGLRLWRTNIGNTDIAALLTGVGTQASSQAMGLMMNMADEDKHFDVCISSGLAGALCDTLAVGDIIAPQSLIAESRHADLPTDELKVDGDLRRLALQAGATDANCLFTADRMFVKASQKATCSSRAQSVDMESFEIVKEASAWGARSVVVRAISDSAAEDLPIDFSLTLSRNHQISLGKVLLEVVNNPLALPALVRFGKQSRHAAKRLARFLDTYVQQLASVGGENRSKEVAAS